MEEYFKDLQISFKDLQISFKELQTCFKTLPKEIRKQIFSYSPPTSPLSNIVKSEAFQDRRRHMLMSWDEEDAMLSANIWLLREADVPWHHPDAAQENMRAMYEWMSINIEGRTAARIEAERELEEDEEEEDEG
jgi:hypothetical protein